MDIGWSLSQCCFIGWLDECKLSSSGDDVRVYMVVAGKIHYGSHEPQSVSTISRMDMGFCTGPVFIMVW